MNLSPNLEQPLGLLAFWGSAAFTAVFLLTAIGILLIPKRLLEQEDNVPPWWRNVRFWAVAICAVQMLVYWMLG
jgi:hypothetical protein